MKRKRHEGEERRRPLAEFNLVGESKPRAGLARRGCLGIFILCATITLAMLGAWPSLH